MLQSLFESCTSIANGERTNWYRVANKVKVREFTALGWQWVDIDPVDFIINYRA
jgi:hypothetical protein